MSEHWINTKTRLPKKNMCVLFAAPGNLEPHHGHIVSDGCWFDACYNCMVNYKITHWRRLPQMPRYQKGKK